MTLAAMSLAGAERPSGSPPAVEGYRGEGGAVAAEFAMVAPVLLLLLFAILQACLLMVSIANLAWATQATARCLGVSPRACPDAQAFGRAHYRGFSAAPTFVVTTDTACGVQVTALARFSVLPGAAGLDAPMTAQACYKPQAGTTPTS